MGKRALLLSGGMDSTCLAYWQRPDLCITIDYGQRPAGAEFKAARAVCHALGIEHKCLSVDCSPLGSGDLAGSAALSVAPASDWWPFRNQLLITLAGAVALQSGCETLLVGAVKSDKYHQDGTPEFVQAISELMQMQEGGLSVEAPAGELSAVELVVQSKVPHDILCWAHSCHTSNYACGECRGCVKHYETWGQISDTAF